MALTLPHIELQIQIILNVITGHPFQIPIRILENVEPKYRDIKMKKIQILIMLMVSTNVLAEWTLVVVSLNGELSSYVDFKTIRKHGNKVKMWDLDDWKSIKTFKFDTTQFSYLSTALHQEFDCTEETVQILDSIHYSGNMGSGNVVDSSMNASKFNEPGAIAPGTIEKKLLDVACSKRK